MCEFFSCALSIPYRIVLKVLQESGWFSSYCRIYIKKLLQNGWWGGGGALPPILSIALKYMNMQINCSLVLYLFIVLFHLSFSWHGTEVQTQNCGVIYGGFLWGVWGTPAYQVHSVVRWDVWEPLWQRRWVLTYTLRWWTFVLCGTVLMWHWGWGEFAVLWGCAVGLL